MAKKTPSIRRARQRLSARTEVLDTARKQIAEHGASTLSLRAIAREMEVTPPALYRYFKNRDELVTALIVDGYNSFSIALEEARAQHIKDSFAIRLMAILVAYREWALTHPQDYVLMFSSPIPNYAPPMEYCAPLIKRSMGVFVSELVTAIQSGEAKPIPSYAKPSPAMKKILTGWKRDFNYNGPTVALHLALTGWTRVHGLVSLELSEQTRVILGNPIELFHNEMVNLFTLVNVDVR